MKTLALSSSHLTMISSVFFAERWSKFGVFGYGPGELQYPCYVTTNMEGNIFVSDMHSSKIHVSRLFLSTIQADSII